MKRLLLPLLLDWWERREDRMRPGVLVLTLAGPLPSAVICLVLGVAALLTKV